MKVGVKLFTSDTVDMIKQRDFSDYIEVYIVPGHPVAKFKDFDREYTIHATHYREGVNLASKSAQKFSIDAMKDALKAADLLNAKWVVMHTGLVNEKCPAGDASLDVLKQSLEALDDPRIILENMPLISSNGKYFGSDYKSLKELSKRFGNRICLDFAHAQSTSVSMNKTDDWIIEGLLKLDVKQFHLNDGHKGKAKDPHISLFDGDFELEKYKRIIDSSFCRRVTLETPIDVIKQRNEVDWLKSQ